MGSRNLVNQLTCLNCGCIVHWTAFNCDICGQNPREKELATEVYSPLENPMLLPGERRRYPRYRFQGKAILDRFFRGELIDLCQQGAKLKTKLHLFRDQIFRLDFAIRGVPIEVTARVVHVKRGVLDERYTLGVFFETIARDQSEVLNHHLGEISEGKSRRECLA